MRRVGTTGCGVILHFKMIPNIVENSEGALNRFSARK